MDSQQFDQLVAQAGERARQALLAKGSHPHTIIIQTEAAMGGVEVESYPNPGPLRHAFFRQLGGSLGAEAGADLGDLQYVLQITEAWAGVAGSREEVERRMARGERVADDPNRLEILLVVGYAPQEKLVRARIYTMERDEEGTLVAATVQEGHAEHGFGAGLLEDFAAGYAEAVERGGGHLPPETFANPEAAIDHDYVVRTQDGRPASPDDRPF